MRLTSDQIAQIKSLQEKGLNIQAHNAAASIAPLADWEGTEARLIAAQLAFHLGAQRLSDVWVKRAWRDDPRHPEAIFYRMSDILTTRGPIAALVFADRVEGGFKGNARETAWWHALMAQILATLRDFKKAEERIAEAFRSDPNDAWVRVSKAHVHELQDRYDEALVFAREAYEMAPTRRANISYFVHLLQLQEKYDESLAVLKRAAREIESGWIIRQLADLQTQLGDHAGAYVSLQKVADLMPLRDDEVEKWLNASLSDAAYLVGDTEAAIRYAGLSQAPFQLRVAERLKDDRPDRRRVLLPTGFLRQHNVTCAPATIANIARFWGRGASHLEIAEAICYDGTPAYKERDWAVANDWAVTEFTLNWCNLRELIDRGAPFTLTTTYPGMGHLQAIVGYDEFRGTAIIRDPFMPQLNEVDVDGLIDQQRSTGPRCMAIVPADQAHLLAGIEFHEKEQYDLCHEVETAISRHDRPRAAGVVAEMERRFPDHRLTLSAIWELHRYDSNGPRLFEIVKRFHELYPKDVNIKLSYLSIAHDYMSRDEKLAKLREFASEKESDPLLWLRYGDELGADFRNQSRALRWLWKAMRSAPGNGEALRGLAGALWGMRDFDRACALYRLAACLGDRDEALSYVYFLAARFSKREDEAIEFLRDRFERFGDLSNYPARTLYEALRETGRAAEAIGLLDEAAKRRPDDGELGLFIAAAKARFGQLEDAETILNAVGGKAPRVAWLQEAAQIRKISGDLAGALGLLREVTESDPTNPEVHSSIAFIISALNGEAAAREYLAGLAERYPFNRSLRLLLLGYLKNDPTEHLKVVRDLVADNSRDFAAQRMLSEALLNCGATDEALAAARTAIEIDPNDAESFVALGRAYVRAVRNAEAVDAFEAAYRLSVDCPDALESRLGLCATGADKRDVLADFFAEMNRQTSVGIGMERYLEAAKRVTDRFDLLKELRGYQSRNPNSWFAVSAVVQLLLDLRKYDEAATLAEENTKRFPLHSKVWYDLSLVHKLHGESDAEIAALREAVAVSPLWSWGIQALCEAYQRAGRLEEAEAHIVDALSRLPLDCFLHGFLADIRWKLGRREEAIESAKRAVAIEPEYEWSWRVIGSWGEELGTPDLAIELARDLTARKPNDVNAWVQLARVLDKDQNAKERLAVSERALELEPEDVRALAQKATALALMRRYDDAIAVCTARRSDGRRPENLRYTEARIEFERGNVQAAVRKLENLGREAPDFYSAFNDLAILYSNSPEHVSDYLRVTKEMTRLAPQDATTFGYYGEACLRAGKESEARDALTQAFRLAPDYTFAGATLFGLLLKDNDADGALRILETLEAFNPDPICRRLRVELAAHMRDVEAARKAWADLCRDSKSDLVQLEEGLKKLTEAGYGSDERIIGTLQAATADPTASVEAGSAEVKRLFAIGRPFAAEPAVRAMRANEKGWEQAMMTLIEELARLDKRQLHEFIVRNQDEISANNLTWATAGNAIQSHLATNMAVTWYEGWEKREDLGAYVFWNMFLVELYRNRLDSAFALNERGLSAKPDGTVNEHLMGRSIEALHRADPVAAREFFGQVNPTRFTEWTLVIYQFLDEALSLEARIADDPDADYGFEVATVADVILDQPGIRRDKMVRGLVDPIIIRMLKYCKSPIKKLWIRGRMALHRTI